MMIFENVSSLLSRAMVSGVSPEMRDALAMIKEEMIEDRQQRIILTAIKDLDSFNSVVSSQSVESMVNSDVDFSFLIELGKNTVPTDAPLRTAMQIVSVYNDNLANHKLKQLSAVIGSGRPFNRDEVSAQLSELSQLVAPSSTSKPKPFYDYAENYINVLEQRQSNPGTNVLDLGVELSVDKTALIVLGGQPGMGKTALALYINDTVVRNGHRALMFSLEMDGGQLFERQVSAYTNIPTQKLKNIDFGDNDLSSTDWGLVGNAIENLSSSKLYIDDDPKLSIPIFIKKCREFKESHPDLALITVDYLTLMQLPDASRRDLSVGEATRLMKLLAKELKTPVLLLSQLNREADKAAREPRNSDLRDSGSIEQDADVIIFPYREEVHDENTVNRGLARILKTKVRDGETGSSVLGFKNGSFKQVTAEWKEKPKEEAPQRRKF